MDPTALSYDSSATSMDPAECAYAFVGCTDSTASTYNAGATVSNSEDCKYDVYGCTFCEVNEEGEVDDCALNFDSLANVYADCRLVILGCIDSTAANYDAGANIDDGQCTPLFPGCTDSAGLNYAPEDNAADNLTATVVEGNPFAAGHGLLASMWVSHGPIASLIRVVRPARSPLDTMSSTSVTDIAAG